jgi:hypothetical protein
VLAPLAVKVKVAGVLLAHMEFVGAVEIATLGGAVVATVALAEQPAKVAVTV